MAGGAVKADGYNLPGQPGGGGSAQGGSGNQGDTNAVWMPKWQDDIFVNTSSVQGVAGASDYNSATYNYTTSKSNAIDEYGSGVGYMESGMTAWMDSVAKAIHPMKNGKSLWKEAVAASDALWESHRVRKTPYQIVTEWAAEISPKRGGGDGSGGGGRGSGAVAMPADASAIRRAMDQVMTGLLGRTMSDKEFNQYYNSYKAEFSGNPDMDPTQHMIESVKQEDDYAEYTVATKFAGALDKVLRGAA